VLAKAHCYHQYRYIFRFLKKNGRLHHRTAHIEEALQLFRQENCKAKRDDTTKFYELKIFLSKCIISCPYLCHIVGINVPKNGPKYDTFFCINLIHSGRFNHMFSL
jgi:hypothetical protein